MDQDVILTLVTAVAGALGIKEIWNIWKKKIDIQAKKDLSAIQNQQRIVTDVIQEQRKTMEEMTTRILSLEEKIDQLVKENIMLREKLARMEERLLLNAKKKVNRKRVSSD
jgi:predicted RNase H-like nuclease (RuvC/YqgF family)